MKVILMAPPRNDLSGVKTHVISLAIGLKKYEVANEIIYSTPNGVGRLAVSGSIRLINLFSKNAALKWSKKIITPYIIYQIKKFINNPEVIFNIQHVNWFHFLKQHFKEITNPIVLTVHGRYSEELISQGYNNKIIDEAIFLEREAYKKASAIVTVSEGVSTYIYELSGRKDINVIPNGVVLTCKTDKHIPNKADSDESLKCVFIGKLLNYKGPDVAVQTIIKAISKGVKVTLDIIGTGPEIKHLYKLIESNNLTKYVRLLGAFPHRKVYNILPKYDVILIPSLPFGNSGEESFPYVCLEAMSSGVVPIASSIGGLKDIISDNIDGFLIQPGDSDTMSSKIIYLSKERSKLKQMSYNALEKIKRKYSNDIMAEKYIEVYKRVINKFN